MLKINLLHQVSLIHYYAINKFGVHQHNYVLRKRRWQFVKEIVKIRTVKEIAKIRIAKEIVMHSKEERRLNKMWTMQLEDKSKQVYLAKGCYNWVDEIRVKDIIAANER